jgi:hypothetical protein
MAMSLSFQFDKHSRPYVRVGARGCCFELSRRTGMIVVLAYMSSPRFSWNKELILMRHSFSLGGAFGISSVDEETKYSESGRQSIEPKTASFAEAVEKEIEGWVEDERKIVNRNFLPNGSTDSSPRSSLLANGPWSGSGNGEVGASSPASPRPISPPSLLTSRLASQAERRFLDTSQ